MQYRADLQFRAADLEGQSHEVALRTRGSEPALGDTPPASFGALRAVAVLRRIGHCAGGFPSDVHRLVAAVLREFEVRYAIHHDASIAFAVFSDGLCDVLIAQNLCPVD